MYDSMATTLASTQQFSIITLDNRGMGLSDAPPSGVFGGPGYNVTQLAQDSWHVIDTVRKEYALCRRVGLVGHSMGGMIVQRMMELRPREVGFCALLSTHAGGWWNLIPTGGMVRCVGRLIWSGFDRDVHAAVNLSLHFTQRFLDGWVGGEDVVEERRRSDDESKNADGFGRRRGCSGDDKNEEERESGATEGKKEERSNDPDDSEARLLPDGLANSHGLRRRAKNMKKTQPSHQAQATEQISADTARIAEFPVIPADGGMSYFESKLIEYLHDARVHFGITKQHLLDTIRHPRHALLHALQTGRRRRRREIYHARYTGRDRMPEADESCSHIADAPDAAHTIFGHFAVVRSHVMTGLFASKLRRCRRIVKLVLFGRHDRVVTPGASRRLAAAIRADTVVEVEGAHFVTEEADAEVTTQVMYGLRKAFYGRRIECECEWCTQKENADGDEDEAAGCRMC